MKSKPATWIEFAVNIMQIYLETQLKTKNEDHVMYNSIVRRIIPLVFIVIIFLNFWFALQILVILYLLSLHFNYLGCAAVILGINLICLIFLVLYLKK